MHELANMIRYVNEQTMVSILVPEEWSGQILNEQQFRLFALPEPDYDHYRSSMSYLRSSAEGRGQAWFEQLIQESEQEMRRDFNEFYLKDEAHFFMHDLVPSYIRWYEWRDEETTLHFSQFQSIIFLADSLYVINAATLKILEDKYIPIFEAILKSTQIMSA